ncbi:MAG: hypothetical protein K2L37_00650, partial [Lactobacillus sp.]|nr:hypothetical protein [Lactobacillus sp.]
MVLQPNKIALTTEMCSDYITSCGNMFGEIIQDYVNTQKDTDVLTACRAVVKQCFDNFGGSGYQNFYYPYSGIISSAGKAIDWFTLYDYSKPIDSKDNSGRRYEYLSRCAQQLLDIDSCKDPAIIEQAFGGLDYIPVTTSTSSLSPYVYNLTSGTSKYGLLENVWKADNNDYQELAASNTYYPATSDSGEPFKQRYLRPTGVATEIYNQIVDILSTQCLALQGRFVEYQFISNALYGQDGDLCKSVFGQKNDGSNTIPSTQYSDLVLGYGVGYGEDMCPRDYATGVDTNSWGACLCWENGARRSKNGTPPKCENVIPVKPSLQDQNCIRELSNGRIAYHQGLATLVASKLSPVRNSTKKQDGEDKDPTKYWCTQ